MSANYLSVQEIASRLRVSRMTAYRLIHEGEMTSVRIGRQFRIEETEVDRYIASNTKLATV